MQDKTNQSKWMNLSLVSLLFFSNFLPDKLKEVLTIEYLSGDRYTGELQGGTRHGIGMFIYKENGEKVIGEWKNNFLIKNGVKHPMESRVGMLIPLGVSKFEGRSLAGFKN